MYSRGIIGAIKKAKQIEQKDLPMYPRKKSPRIPRIVAARVKALKSWRDEQVDLLALDPALICNKALISAIAFQRPRKAADLSAITEMKNWQKKEFGRDILQVMKQVR